MPKVTYLVSEEAGIAGVKMHVGVTVVHLAWLDSKCLINVYQSE